MAEGKDLLQVLWSGADVLVPSGSTYKLRSSEITYDGKRVMPSYIMTGGNIQIEKSKVQMITEDIAEVIRLIGA